MHSPCTHHVLNMYLPCTYHVLTMYFLYHALTMCSMSLPCTYRALKVYRVLTIYSPSKVFGEQVSGCLHAFNTADAARCMWAFCTLTLLQAPP